ncbi:MAG: putative sulfate exporter family transporter [Methanomicrobiales archaeon]|nr:putative sulfate exporter family transporter [Methanomicrobiales archaeon]
MFNIHLSPVFEILKGLIIPIVIGIIAWSVGSFIPVLGGPVIAIFIGLIIGQIFGVRKEWEPGITFAVKRVLQGSIVLLGAGMSLTEVARIGISGLPVMVGTLVLCIACGFIIGRILDVEYETRSLVTYGTAICGASAIATMSAVMKASGPAVAISITVIVLYNVLGAVLFPTLGHMMGLSQESFGLWAGTAINDTSSVMAAATVYGALATSYAVVVKLTRTLAIVPLALFQSWVQNRELPSEEQDKSAWYHLVPPFLVFFLVAAVMQSVGLIPDILSVPLKFLARFGIIVAMAAVGMSSSITAVKDAGWRPVALGGILWVIIATSSLALQWITGKI